MTKRRFAHISIFVVVGIGGSALAAGCAGDDGHVGRSKFTAAELEGGAGSEPKATRSGALSGCNADAIRAGTPASRKNIIDRALRWADPASPLHGDTSYSQSQYFEGYRMDCSGFVSMSWGLDTSRCTWNFAPAEDDVSEEISWGDLQPGDAVNDPSHHIMLFAGWLDESQNQFCVMEEYDYGHLASIRPHGGPGNEGQGSGFHPIRYKNAGAVPPGSGSSGGGNNSGGGAKSCHSETLGHDVPANACLQSKFDDAWYQCDDGVWVDRWSDPDECTSTSPLGQDNTGGGSTSCHSDTLGKDMPQNACVQSKFDDTWYQCDKGTWVDRWSDAEACSSTSPLGGTTQGGSGGGSSGTGGSSGGGGKCGSTPGSGDKVTRWNNVVTCVLGMLGLPASEALIHDVDIVIDGESGGDPNAVNDWDRNAKNGTPSTGLVQVIRPTFDTYRSHDLPDDLSDPAANLYAGMNYGIHTYGSIQQIPGVASVNEGGPYLPYRHEIGAPFQEPAALPAAGDAVPSFLTGR